MESFLWSHSFPDDLLRTDTLPKLNLQLIPKFRRELRPGTRIVSHKFDMGDDWPPETSQDVNGLMIYLWTIR